MGREVRKVPANWVHPRNDKGALIPLYEGGGYAGAAAEWDEGYAKWQQGLRESYGSGEKWVPIDPEYANTRYTDYAGSRPSPDDYMPNWPEAERTHFMMYEDTSEGTPISPAFSTPEELAAWLTNTGASAFGRMTATYEQWLNVTRGAWAPSLVISNGVMSSGVADSLPPRA